MSNFDRRQFLKGLLGKLAQAAGTVVVASVTASSARAQGGPPEEAGPAPDGVQERADRLAAAANLSAEEAEAAANEFLNGAFRNTPLGGFGNGPLGGFRNTPLGGFGNGGWPNGHWGGFGNGGWPNGWNNWW